MPLLQSGLDDLLEEMGTAPEVYRPSVFWQELWGRRHPAQRKFFEALYDVR